MVDDDLAGHRGDRVVVAQHRALDLAGVDGALEQHLAIECQRRAHRGLQRRGVPDAGDADRRAGVGRLHEQGVTERLGRGERGGRVGPQPRRRHQREVDDRDAGVPQQPLGDVLVHADRRTEHAGADVGDLGQLQQSLHGAVLTVGAVQHRKNDRVRAGCELAQSARGSACRTDEARLDRDRPGPPHPGPARRGLPAAAASVRSDSLCQRPSRSIPISTGSKRVRSSADTTLRADSERDLVLRRAPPNRTMTRVLFISISRRSSDPARRTESSIRRSAARSPSPAACRRRARRGSRPRAGSARLLGVGRRRLQPRRHLARVHRVDAGVGLGRVDEDGGIADAVAHAVVGRIGGQPAERLGIVGASRTPGSRAAASGSGGSGACRAAAPRR